MGSKLFSGISEVAIQGKRVLRFVNFTQDRAIYEIIGFENPSLTLVDYRKTGLQAIQDLLGSGNLFAFAPAFNSLSRVDVWETDDGGLSIELNDPADEPVEHV